MQPSKTATAFLLAGLLAGLALAGLSLVERRADRQASLPDSVIAEVNQVPIAREAYDTQLEGLAGDKRNEITDADRVHVLERMIEEELLIQRGVEIGLMEQNRPVRAAIADAMISAITAETQAQAVSDDVLEEFYQDNQAYFSRAPQLHVDTVRLRKDADFEALQIALNAGPSLAEIEQGFGAPQIVRAPQTLLPLAKLRDYVGPSLLQAAMAADIGVLTGPVESGGGQWLVLVYDRQYHDVPPFEDIRDLVEQAWRKQAGDEALRDYLDWLKARAQLVRAP